MNPTCYLPDALIPKFDFFPNKKGNSKNSYLNNTLSWTLHKEVFFPLRQIVFLFSISSFIFHLTFAKNPEVVLLRALTFQVC